ncbi:class IV adenylate cyclase [Flavobacterium sp.]|uniref:class IV adenylate cyclase n=1 Tax=Flavobacterium sp. TaxID=239 RepID=UPI004033EB7E
MAQNIEIKARLEAPLIAENLIRTISNKKPTTLNQIDVFYRVPFGRLKSRNINNTENELIFYFRPNKVGPKSSYYLRLKPLFPSITKRMLSKVLGVKGIVEKQRTLYMLDNTRIHIDKVKELGTFIEFEYVVNPQKNASIGRDKVQELLDKLQISTDSLCANSYLEMNRIN